MTKPKTQEEPVVQILDFKHYQYVTFWCPLCETRHTFTGKRPRGFIPIKAHPGGPIFVWDGNAAKPTVYNVCIVNQTPTDNDKTKVCHVFIEDGVLRGNMILLPWADREIKRINLVPMLPVSHWPIVKPPKRANGKTRKRK